MPIASPNQIRAARAFIGWSMVDLARAATVSLSTVRRLEDGGVNDISARMRVLIRIALEKQGVTFLTDNGAGVGLRVGAFDQPAR